MTQKPGSEFNFLAGAWKVQHRRLKTRLAGAEDWEEFSGQTTAHLTLGGLGNIDDNILELPDGRYRAISLRSYDPSTKLWAIWWLDGRKPHDLDVPVVGGFSDGIGLFYAEDIFEGKAIKVRFVWRDMTTASPCWEQAFSPDNGQTWEVNWTMSFTR
ncbi:hypothetical protein [Kiloniella laminariae]|uniref:hypothetical protein n=1 Tax=Kiloniella laminariae TaxID=454162 RepID=UPI00037A137B|nr:hypothetical protein [Kiloniella laminariae]